MSEKSPNPAKPTVVPPPLKIYPVLGPRLKQIPGTQENVPMLGEDALRRHDGRILDPDTAAQPVKGRVPDDGPPGKRIRYRPTAYVADQILLPSDPLSDSLTKRTITEIAKSINLHIEPDQSPDRRGKGPSSYLAAPITAYDEVPPDAWRLVQKLRDQTDFGQAVALNHLMTGAEVISGTTFRTPVGIASRGPATDYSTPGWGGRGPVSLFAAPPLRRPAIARRPVVAIVDTGVADHVWFEGCISRMVATESGWVEDANSNDDGKEIYPNLIDPLQGELDPYFGHGTFIAGLIRQHCPDADILSIKIMGPDGVVEESRFLGALDYLVTRQKRAQAKEADADPPIDILSISLGYYHEEPADVVADGPLKERLDRLRSLGVTVVAAAGNDSTTRPFLPAALASYQGGVLTEPTPTSLRSFTDDLPPAKWPPLISVGALNPSLSVALFSNGGNWVSCYAPGALLVSTTPVSNADAQPNVVLDDTTDGVRGTGPAATRSSVDPDFYTGFGTWSGTSFAAPIAAAALAQHLLAGPPDATARADAAPADLADATPEAMARRAAEALADLGFPGPGGSTAQE